ncbi:cytochrome c oxidase assembly factor 6 homolog [Dermatophagoides farinae]|uniref:Cytochrome c oxidase assembly factor 6 n=1 Tax=Dermatophagoides farinae TaxID=6954 RepID=A0A922HS37_DERFA|nr:cytochrome c oxidase assembly factor 6 homolog [Dermatophagoides farinae]KAH7645262.1 cytochrome c oxidase assembly factor 6 [Dermatophagoides farinae]KAH9497944.1 Cytochrome c oxidase assembly factor 6 [Dermatophagoides farinae]
MSSFPRKENRLKCYASRDQYWHCLDQHSNVKNENNDDQNQNNNIPDECKKLKSLFETDCPQQWVQHFNRKYRYLKFKDKIEKGFEPIDNDDEKK